MGQELTYTSTTSSFRFPISRSDWQLSQALRTYVPDEIEILFEVGELGEKSFVAVDDLRRAANRLSEFFNTESDKMPFTYQFKCEQSLNANLPPGGYGTGGMSGIRLPNDRDHFYSIHAGFNQCELKKIAIGEDGRGILVETIDLRNTKEIKTDTVGAIKIKRSRKRTDLSDAVARIRAFLNTVSDEKIVKSIE